MKKVFLVLEITDGEYGVGVMSITKEICITKKLAEKIKRKLEEEAETWGEDYRYEIVERNLTE